MGIVKNTTLSFEIEGTIGDNEGKNSSVFLATDKQLGARLVVKQITKESLKNLGIDIEEYYNESQALYASKSPYVVEIQYACEDEENIYLTMPYLKSGSLNKVMDEKNLTVREIIKYSNDILNGLALIHSKHLIHLDLKPTNILIDDSGKAKITDFGLAKFLDENGLAEQGYSYNWHREPESFLINKRSIYSDIYQFGMILYRMCNGNNILNKQAAYLKIDTWDRLKQCITEGKFPFRKYYLPHIPLKLRKIVEKCLSLNPTDRYNNVIDIMNELNSIIDCLDWRYCPTAEYIYQKFFNNKYILLKVEEYDNHFNIISIRTDYNGNNQRRIIKYCKENLKDEASIRKQLEYIIKDIN